MKWLIAKLLAKRVALPLAALIAGLLGNRIAPEQSAELVDLLARLFASLSSLLP